MKANEFIKKFGWDSLLIAKTLPKFDRYKYVTFYADEIDFSNEFHAGRKSYMFEVAEIKRLIRSRELVEKWQGLEASKIKVNLLREFGFHTQADQLQQAVNDMGECQ